MKNPHLLAAKQNFGQTRKNTGKSCRIYITERENLNPSRAAEPLPGTAGPHRSLQATRRRIQTRSSPHRPQPGAHCAISNRLPAPPANQRALSFRRLSGVRPGPALSFGFDAPPAGMRAAARDGRTRAHWKAVSGLRPVSHACALGDDSGRWDCGGRPA